MAQAPGLAPVIPLRPVGQRTPNCFICVKAAVTDVTVCTVVGEVIDQEAVVALECPTYEEDCDAR